MHFEWDERKNVENIRRRGIDFSDARRVFQRPVLRMLDDRKEYGEDRWIGIGMLDGIRIVVVVFTELDANTIRIISMRKAVAHERQRYQQAFRDQFGSI
jgi:uncharacterized DUF497 family protein